MKRRLLSSIIFFVLLTQLLLPAMANETVAPVAEIYSSYWQKGILHSYVQFDAPNSVVDKVNLMVNNLQIGTAYPQSAQQANTSIHYMLLIDTSTSMPWYRNQILSFAEELMKAEQNIKISIARFDSAFSVVDTDLTSFSDVKQSIGSLKFNKDGSDINGSAAAAIEYLGSTGYSSGDMPNLVVITDGKTWYTNDRKREQKLEEESNNKLAILMNAYPEVVVHTLSFGEWSESTFAPYTNSKGMHFPEDDIASAGFELAKFTDSIRVVNFPLGGYDQVAIVRDSLMLCVGNHFISYKDVRNVDIPAQVDVDTNQEDIPTESSIPIDSSEPDSTESTDPAESTEPSVPQAEVEVETEDNAGTMYETVTNSNDGNQVDDPADPNSADSSMIWFLICSIAVLMIIAIVFFSIKNWNKRNNSVRMRIEVISGDNLRIKTVYYLVDELLIGSDNKCDLIIPYGHDAVSTRIYKHGQLIYIEDLSSSSKTMLNGMQIFSSNRLRSGDEISIETVVLRVLF